VTKAKIPEAIPTSIVDASNGLLLISSIMVLPEGVEAYNEFESDEPTKNSTGINIISQNDHFPSVVFGIYFIQ
jgi:hypothetical protein